MAGYHLVGLFGNLWHRGRHRGIVRTKNNQARGAGLDMVPLVQALTCTDLVVDVGVE